MKENAVHNQSNSVAILVLETGACYVGVSYGASAVSLDQYRTPLADIPAGFGEVVINTAMVGYPEVLTDPSYIGQIVVMTYPHIGNYGINQCWSESKEVHAKNPSAPIQNDIRVQGLILRAGSYRSAQHAETSLERYLAHNRIPAITDLDTRALTRATRSSGALYGIITRAPQNFKRWDALHTIPQRWQERAQQIIQHLKQMHKTDAVNHLTPQHTKPLLNKRAQKKLSLLLFDCGCKSSIVTELSLRNCAVQIIPHNISVQEIRSARADGIVISNGPGDPSPLTVQTATIKALLGEIPLFGICMGHQLIAQALGAQTYKLPFGHHGINHPVRCSTTETVYVTSQNHEFAVDGSTIPNEIEIWFENANDTTVEGLIDHKRKIYSVQFHPEAAPGPHDVRWVFDFVLKQIRGAA